MMLVLACLVLRVEARVLPQLAISSVAGVATSGAGVAAEKVVEWTLDAGAEYWASPDITPYIAVAEIATVHHDIEKGTGTQTTRNQGVASWIGFGPKSKVVYTYRTALRTIHPDGRVTLTTHNDAFSWNSLERRSYYCSTSHERSAGGSMPALWENPTYQWFHMRFKLAAYCTAKGITSETGSFPTQVVVGRRTRQADCNPVTAESVPIVRSFAVPMSGIVFFEWDNDGNFLYENPKFLEGKPRLNTVSVNVLPDPRVKSRLPQVAPVPTDPNTATNY